MRTYNFYIYIQRKIVYHPEVCFQHGILDFYKDMGFDASSIQTNICDDFDKEFLYTKIEVVITVDDNNLVSVYSNDEGFSCVLQLFFYEPKFQSLRFPEKHLELFRSATRMFVDLGVIGMNGTKLRITKQHGTRTVSKVVRGE